jgi:hypothetical protein
VTRMPGDLLATCGRTNKEIRLDFSVAPRSTQNWARFYRVRERRDVELLQFFIRAIGAQFW